MQFHAGVFPFPGPCKGGWNSDVRRTLALIVALPQRHVLGALEGTIETTVRLPFTEGGQAGRCMVPPPQVLVFKFLILR